MRNTLSDRQNNAMSNVCPMSFQCPSNVLPVSFQNVPEPTFRSRRAVSSEASAMKVVPFDARCNVLSEYGNLNIQIALVGLIFFIYILAGRA